MPSSKKKIENNTVILDNLKNISMLNIYFNCFLEYSIGILYFADFPWELNIGRTTTFFCDIL